MLKLQSLFYPLANHTQVFLAFKVTNVGSTQTPHACWKTKCIKPIYSLTHSTWWHQPFIINFNDHQHPIIHQSIYVHTCTHTSARQQAPQILENNYSLHFVYYLLREAWDSVCVCVPAILACTATFLWPTWHSNIKKESTKSKSVRTNEAYMNFSQIAMFPNGCILCVTVKCCINKRRPLCCYVKFYPFYLFSTISIGFLGFNWFSNKILLRSTVKQISFVNILKCFFFIYKKKLIKSKKQLYIFISTNKI